MSSVMYPSEKGRTGPSMKICVEATNELSNFVTTYFHQTAFGAEPRNGCMVKASVAKVRIQVKANTFSQRTAVT